MSPRDSCNFNFSCPLYFHTVEGTISIFLHSTGEIRLSFIQFLIKYTEAIEMKMTLEKCRFC